MEFIFADDSEQKRPYRKGMGHCIAIGGIIVKDSELQLVEKKLNSLCTRWGFPNRLEPFKWSPEKKTFFSKLTNRERFFKQVLTIASIHKIKCIIIIEDTNYSPANPRKSPKDDCLLLFLERIEMKLKQEHEQGIIIVDRPGGGRGEETTFLENCLEDIQTGSDYVRFKSIPLNVLTSNSKCIRLLQLADVITSCTLSYVCGEKRYSPEIFEFIKPLFPIQQINGVRYIGGHGLKIHPDSIYKNLYYWLLGDTISFTMNKPTLTLPNTRYNYAINRDDPIKHEK